MKRFFLLLFALPFFMTSCSNSDAEAAADEFHKRMDNGEIDYAMEHLVDTENSTPEMIVDFKGVLETIHSWGKQENRKKTSGFNRGYHNGVSTVKLSYTCEIDGTLMHERLVMIDTDEGYKVLVIAINPDETIVDQYVADY